MQVLHERCAAVGVGKDVIAVAARMPGGGPDGGVTVKRTYKTFCGVLREMARWLASLGVTRVAVESAGSYSMPVYHALPEHGDFSRVLVCNARHVKNVPGRKRDLADAEWLALLLECGLLAGSFIPPAEVKAARDVVGYRKKIARQRASGISRPGDVLQGAGIKIGSVASSIAAKSGIAVIGALADGEHRALMCRLRLDRLRRLDAMLEEPDAQIEEMMRPFRAAVQLLVSVPGIAEVTPPPRTTSPSAAHAASWCGTCPGSHESAGKRYGSPREQGHHRRRARPAGDQLACPGRRRALPRARRRLLRPPRRPRARDRPPAGPPGGPRPPRHPGGRRSALLNPGRSRPGHPAIPPASARLQPTAEGGAVGCCHVPGQGGSTHQPSATCP